MAFKDVPECGATTRMGRTCKQPRMANGRCKMHGGKTPRGIASPNLKTGMYSKDLPSRLLSRVEAVLHDPALLSVRNDIALMQAEIGDRLSRIKQGEAEPDFEQILGMAERISRDWQKWDWTRMNAELASLKEAIGGEIAQDRAMREVRDLIQEKARLIAQENRLLESRDHSMPIEQVMLLIRALTTAMRRTIRDPDLLTAVDAEFRRITSNGEGAD